MMAFLESLRNSIESTFRGLSSRDYKVPEQSGFNSPSPAPDPRTRAIPDNRNPFTRSASDQGLALDPRTQAIPDNRNPFKRATAEQQFGERIGMKGDESEAVPVQTRFDPNTRESRIATSYELTDEQFAALSPEQQNAVRFNTGLVSAARADEESGNNQATQDYMGQLGIRARSENEINEFLNLDRLIGDSIIKQLGPNGDTQAPFKPQEDVRGDVMERAFGPRNIESLAPENIDLTNAQSDAQRAATALAAQLRTTGFGFGEQPTEGRVGFGTSMHDDIVRKMYATMVDSRYDLNPEAVTAGLAEMNSQAGTQVTPQQVWDFMNSQLSAAEVGGGKVELPWDNDPVSGEMIKPLEPGEIRKRYGM